MRFVLVNLLLIISLELVIRGRSAGICSELICGDFITVRLDTKRLLFQHISLLGYASLPAFVWLLGTVVERCCNAVHGQPPVRFAYHLLITVAAAPLAADHIAAFRCAVFTNCR